jgi:hypothetical protein
MKMDIKVTVYYCIVGSVLAFPANICFHATVTPRPMHNSGKQQPRDMIIFHPLVFDTET